MTLALRNDEFRSTSPCVIVFRKCSFSIGSSGSSTTVNSWSSGRPTMHSHALALKNFRKISYRDVPSKTQAYFTYQAKHKPYFQVDIILFHYFSDPWKSKSSAISCSFTAYLLFPMTS